MEYQYLSDARSQAQINANRDNKPWTVRKTHELRQKIGLKYTLNLTTEEDENTLLYWREICRPDNGCLRPTIDEIFDRIAR